MQISNRTNACSVKNRIMHWEVNIALSKITGWSLDPGWRLDNGWRFDPGYSSEPGWSSDPE